MSNQRWSADKNIQFISEYQRHECLWDPNHPQYKTRESREAAYRAIMVAMEMDTVKDVVLKIRTLRNTYNNEILKTKKSYIPGMTTDRLYISKIPWLHHLDFIKNIDCPKENVDSYPRESMDSYTREGVEKENMDNYPREHMENCPAENMEVVYSVGGNTDNNWTPNNTQENSASESDIREFAVLPTLPTAPAPTRIKRKLKDPLHKAIDALKMVSTQHFTNTATNDEFDFFGKTVAEQLRHLPIEIALETEEIVLSVIRKQRIKVAKKMSSPTEESAQSKNYKKLLQQKRQQNFAVDDERMEDKILQKAVENVIETDPNHTDR